jgi:hypothetical protein
LAARVSERAPEAPGRWDALLRRRRPLGAALAVVAAGVAVVWLLVVPEVPAGAGALRGAVLRWGHAVVWLLLAAAAAAWAAGARRRTVERLAVAALAVYAAFVLALVTA